MSTLWTLYVLFASSPLPFNADAVLSGEFAAFSTNTPQDWAMGAAERIDEHNDSFYYMVQGTTKDSTPAELSIRWHEGDTPAPLREPEIARYLTKVDKGTKPEAHKTDYLSKSGLHFRLVEHRVANDANQSFSEAYLTAKNILFVITLKANSVAHFDKFHEDFIAFLDNIHPADYALPYNHAAQLVDKDAKKAGDIQAFINVYLNGLTGLRKAVPACVKSKQDETHAILEIGATGQLDKMTLMYDDSLGVCLKQALLGKQGPKPPFAPFHIPLDMRFQ